MTEILDRLALRAGLQPTYDDIFGKRVVVPDETKRTLLGAMGFDAADDEAAARSLRALEAREWERLLPPVHVAAVEEAVELPVNLPREAGGALRWQVRLENGRELVGEADVASLPVRAEANLDGALYLRRLLALSAIAEPGYHQVTVELGDAHAAARLIVAPQRCVTPDEFVPGGRLWGYTVQVYGLRSRRDWGMGDFRDLGDFAEGAAGVGAQAVGVNPLHALFLADPQHLSPYSPNTRNALNPLYICVEKVPELADTPDAQAKLADPDFQARVAALREGELIDHPAVHALKLEVLEPLWRTFRDRDFGRDTGRGRAFENFRTAFAPHVQRLALFDALHEEMIRRWPDKSRWVWRDWPEEFRSPGSPAVEEFARAHEDRILFFQWLQFVADEQLAEASLRAKMAGMPVGLYRDVAVGAAPEGSYQWADTGDLVGGATFGSPPDAFNMEGQGWGLAPFNPLQLIERGYQPFVDMLRANMRHAGALRIDHVMALMRLYWIPQGKTPKEGAYVHYPLDDLLRIVALESHRHNCVVIGEDLGTVPEGFRPKLAEAGVLSCRVLLFERGPDGGFIMPEHYPASALVSISTHDLPTLAGIWHGRDIEWRRDLGILTPEEANEQLLARRTEVHKLLDSLIHSGALHPLARPDADLPPLSVEIATAVHRYIASTPGWMVMVQIEDALGEVEQVNLPGTTSGHPNWQRRLRLPVEEIFDELQVQLIAQAVREKVTGG